MLAVGNTERTKNCNVWKLGDHKKNNKGKKDYDINMKSIILYHFYMEVKFQFFQYGKGTAREGLKSGSRGEVFGQITK